MRVAIAAALLLSAAQLPPRPPQPWPPPPATTQGLVCVSSAVVYSPAGDLTVEIPDAPKYYWGALIARDALGVGIRTATFSNVEANANPILPSLRRPGWGGGRIPITALIGHAPSWRYVFGYTMPLAKECVASLAVPSERVGTRDHAITAPAAANIERVEISSIDTSTGIETVCGTWRKDAALPSSGTCGAGENTISFSLRKCLEPANPPIVEGVAGVPLIFLEAAQGLRFSCSGTSDHSACRVELRWTPK